MNAEQQGFDFERFAPREAARASDPVTSVMAAESVAPLVRRDRLAVLAIHYKHRGTGLDDFQLAEIMQRKQTSVGKRRGDLANPEFFNPPLIASTGERRRSPSSLTNSVVMVWRITQAGIDYYERQGNK